MESDITAKDFSLADAMKLKPGASVRYSCMHEDDEAQFRSTGHIANARMLDCTGTVVGVDTKDGIATLSVKESKPRSGWFFCRAWNIHAK